MAVQVGQPTLFDTVGGVSGGKGYTCVDTPARSLHEAGQTPRSDTMRLTILGPRDERGRCTFTLEWWGYRPDLESKGPRGQYFYGRPENHIADLERRGWRVL